MKVPQTTTPLTKLVRTTEGVLVVASNVMLVVLGAVGDMAWTKVGTAAAVLNGVTIVARSVLKGVAALSPMVGDPIIPDGIDVTPVVPDGAEALSLPDDVVLPDGGLESAMPPDLDASEGWDNTTGVQPGVAVAGNSGVQTSAGVYQSPTVVAESIQPPEPVLVDDTPSSLPPERGPAPEGQEFPPVQEGN